jgi:hypothetical protein
MLGGQPNHLACWSAADRRIALGLFLVLWGLFGAFRPPPFTLQGAVLEALVERGQIHFERGYMAEDGQLFVNLDTVTPEFRRVVNVFPSGGVFRVNHAPGQFFLTAPVYGIGKFFGWRFSDRYERAWRLVIFGLVAPLGALGISCLYFCHAPVWDHQPGGPFRRLRHGPRQSADGDLRGALPRRHRGGAVARGVGGVAEGEHGKSL